MDTHSELIEDLAQYACLRWLGRPKGRTAYHAFHVLRDAHEALGGLRLARTEEWADATREADVGLRMALSIRSNWVERGIATH